MGTFKKTNVKLFAKLSNEFNSDNAYWKNYSAPVLIKEYGPIDHINFSPNEPYNFAVTCSSRVQVYNPISKLVIKNFNRFKKTAYGGTFRRDGKLLCAGGEEADVKLFDVNTRNPLRIFTGHTAAVHRTLFTLDGKQIVSFSDDKSVSLWDIPSEKQIISLEGHNDYVRSGDVSPINPDILISGGYDRIVNMFDTRANKKVLSVDHGAPVESVLFLPSGGIFLTAGGTEIRVWDALINRRLLAKVSQHHKTITCLQLSCDGKRILSGSLDRHVKIYEPATYKTVHTLDYPNSISSIGISVNDKTIAVGMVDGMISIQQRELTTMKSIAGQNKSRRYAGDNLHSPFINTYVEEVKKDVMSKHDVCLRKFQYSKALDHVMSNYMINKSPETTVALLQELIRRQGLAQALAGRKENSINQILKFITRYISNLRFDRVIRYTLKVLLDTYFDKLRDFSLDLQKMFEYATKKMETESELQLNLAKLNSLCEMFVSAAKPMQLPNISDNYQITPSTIAQESLVLKETEISY